MGEPCQSTVLGKRKTSTSKELVLRLSPRAMSDASLQETDGESTSPVASSSKTPFVIINGILQPDTKKRYRCVYEGCQKAYTKPSRLEEHERSHTGQRPFICVTCSKSYLRETHLHAHARSHLPESARPLECERSGCFKRFWTSQHLNVHYSWHDGAKPYKCSVDGCFEAFSKHHQLRTHMCAEHSPPGTKPFQCEHEGCSKSFDTNQHLKTHQKTHDAKRYTCVHQGCLPTGDATPTYFPTWSALQSHIRTRHPATCLHPSCNGKVFSNQGNLRAHLKLHEQANIEAALGDDTGNETDQPPRKKRRGGEYGRDWHCEEPDCDKDFKSKKALKTHVNITHLGKRDFVCSYPDCHQAYGYKHLLRRHEVKAHQTNQSGTDYSDDEDVSNTHDVEAPEIVFDIEKLTGHAYAKKAQESVRNAQALTCPFPKLADLLIDDGTGATSEPPPPTSSSSPCGYVFSRGYDLRRHLQSAHSLTAQKEAVDTWVRKRKYLLKKSVS